MTSVCWAQDLREKFNGKVIEVGIKDVAPQMRKVVLSMQQATNNKLIKQLTVRMPSCSRTPGSSTKHACPAKCGTILFLQIVQPPAALPVSL